MIHVMQQKQLLSDGRLIELIMFKNKSEQKLAAYLKVGMGREAVKLLMGRDYRNFTHSNDELKEWKKKQVWLPGKKIRIAKTVASVAIGFDNENTSLDEMALNFSKKAVRGLAFARGEIEAKPLAKAKADAAHAKHLKGKAEREDYYSNIEGSGLF
ncbi:MAG: hypothetical protein NXH70_02490 [Hyphomonas sp.]|nr:hypothetical protein [Hyphomonas sp.]